MRKGDFVRFKDVADAGDEGAIMVLLEDPDGGRVLVQDLVDMQFPPSHIYSVDDLVLVDR
jgi:hypothetical protein